MKTLLFLVFMFFSLSVNAGLFDQLINEVGKELNNSLGGKQNNPSGGKITGECDSNYKKTGVNIFGPLYAGDSVSDAICHLKASGFATKVHTVNAINFDVNSKYPLGKINNKKYTYFKTLQLDARGIKISGIEYDLVITYITASSEYQPLMGLGKSRLDQGRKLTKYFGKNVVELAESYVFYPVDEKLITQRQWDGVIDTLKESMLKKGFKKSDFKINNVGDLRICCKNGMEVHADNEDAKILIFYDPFGDTEPEMKSAINSIDRIVNDPKNNPTDSNIKF